MREKIKKFLIFVEDYKSEISKITMWGILFTRFEISIYISIGLVLSLLLTFSRRVANKPLPRMYIPKKGLFLWHYFIKVMIHFASIIFSIYMLRLARVIWEGIIIFLGYLALMQVTSELWLPDIENPFLWKSKHKPWDGKYFEE